MKKTAMESEQEKASKKPLLPIRFTGLFGKRPVMQRTEKTPEPTKLEAPQEPTFSSPSTSRVYGKTGNPVDQTKGAEQFKEAHL